MQDNAYAGDDVYCDQVLSGIMAVNVVMETPDVQDLNFSRRGGTSVMRWPRSSPSVSRHRRDG